MLFISLWMFKNCSKVIVIYFTAISKSCIVSITIFEISLQIPNAFSWLSYFYLYKLH